MYRRYFPIVELSVENLITLLFNNLVNELFLTRPEKGHANGLLPRLKDVLLDDLLLIEVAAQLLLDEHFKLPKMTKFYLLFNDLLLQEMRLLLPGAHLFSYGFRDVTVPIETLTVTHLGLFFLLALLVFFDYVLELEVAVLVVNQILADVHQESGLFGLFDTVHVLTNEP